MIKQKRYWEIDALRGVAIIFMIVLHALVDLYLLGRQRLYLSLSLWYIFQKITITIFMLLAGVSLSIKSYRVKSRIQQEGRGGEFVKRGIELIAWGMLITFSTRLFLAEGFVVFGVLHCIGLSTMIIRPFLRRGAFNLWLGILFTFVGIFIPRLHPSWPWLLWLGLAPRGFYSVDYVPLLPWFGVILIGLYLGSVLYSRGERLYCLPKDMNAFPIPTLTFLGRYSLWIYLVHQPIILCFYKVLGWI